MYTIRIAEGTDGYWEWLVDRSPKIHGEDVCVMQIAAGIATSKEAAMGDARDARVRAMRLHRHAD